MVSKKAAAAACSGEQKRKLNVVSLEKKREIIEKIEMGMKVADVAKIYNLPRTTVSTYWNHKQKIIETNVLPVMSRTVSEKKRPLAVNEMESLLLLWIKEKQRAGESIAESVIRKKAKEIYNNLTEDDKERVDFLASPGWFSRFKNRHGVQNGETAGADKTAADEFVSEFCGFIEAEGFVSSQIFNCVDTGLFWKKMPKRTYITAAEAAVSGPKPMKDRLTLLLCTNASGDFKLKPLLVYHSKNPRAFKRLNVSVDTLPVMWRSNIKGRVTRLLFIEWLREIFATTVKKYLEDKGLPLRCVLVLDNAPSHPPDLASEIGAEFPWITMKFLPSKTTSLIQPMDRLVITNFKKLYTKHMFRTCYDITNFTDLTLRDFWKKNYDIYQAVQLIDKALTEMSRRTLKSAWRKLLPSVIPERDLASFEEERKQEEEYVMGEILDLCKDLQLEADSNDIEELVNSHQDDLTTEDLRQLFKENQREKRGKAGDDLKPITTQVLEDSIRKWGELEEVIRKYYPIETLACAAINNINESIMPFFHSLLKNRKKQVTLSRFLKRTSDKAKPGCSRVKRKRKEKPALPNQA